MDIAITNPTSVKSTEGMINKLSHAPITITLEQIFTTDNLYKAYKDTRKSKRNKHRVFEFEKDLAKNIEDLRLSIHNGTYKPKPCREFDIWCTAGQKIRHITAPDFSDNVAQFCLYNSIYPLYDKFLISQTCGCRKGKGALFSANLTQNYIRQSPLDSYYLQTDIKKYYYNIDLKVLRLELARYIQDKRIIDIIMLWCGKTKGVNVGSLIAQFIGLIYLNHVDQFIKRVLKVKRYVRYVDDMIFIGVDYNQCKYILSNLISILSVFGLSLSKWKILPLRKGINFCGYRTKKHIRFVRKRVLKTFRKRLKSHNYRAIESVLSMCSYSANYSSLIRLLKIKNLNYPKYLNRRISKWQSTRTLKSIQAHHSELN